MYVILVYDVAIERVSKLCKFLRRYLNWVQNSVFEGELTPSELGKIKAEIKKLINSNMDSIIIYQVRDKNLLRTDHIGIQKVELSQIV